MFRGGHEHGALHCGINALVRGGRDQSHLSVWDVRTQAERGHCKSGRRSSPDADSAGSLIFDFPASAIVRKKCSLIKPPRV